jgi:hypothetical protein
MLMMMRRPEFLMMRRPEFLMMRRHTPPHAAPRRPRAAPRRPKNPDRSVPTILLTLNQTAQVFFGTPGIYIRYIYI